MLMGSTQLGGAEGVVGADESALQIFDPVAPTDNAMVKRKRGFAE